MYRNGSPVATASTSVTVIAGGSPGIGINSPSGQGLTLDNWEGGNLVAAPTTRLVITSVPVSATAGAGFSVTVQAQDANGNPVNVVGDTAILLTSSGTGILSGNTGTINAGENSVTLTSVEDPKAETITLTATRTSGDNLSASAASSSIQVNAGVASKLAVTSVPVSATAGVGFPVTVQAQDANGNPANVVGDTGISLTSSGTGTLSGNAGTINAGANSVTLASVVDPEPETITLTATRTSGDSLSDSAPSSSIQVNPAAANKLVITSVPISAMAGVGFSVTVQVQDANGNPVNVGWRHWYFADVIGDGDAERQHGDDQRGCQLGDPRLGAGPEGGDDYPDGHAHQW